MTIVFVGPAQKLNSIETDPREESFLSDFVVMLVLIKLFNKPYSLVFAEIIICGKQMLHDFLVRHAKTLCSLYGCLYSCFISHKLDCATHKLFTTPRRIQKYVPGLLILKCKVSCVPNKKLSTHQIYFLLAPYLLRQRFYLLIMIRFSSVPMSDTYFPLLSQFL